MLSSGRHSSHYVQCARALEHPGNCSQLGTAIADGLPQNLDCILAAPLGGLLIGYEVARALDVPLLFPERDDTGTYVLRRGFRIERGSEIGIVEDVITTGRTTRELLALVREAGAVVRAIGTIIDRTPDHLLDDAPIASLVQLDLPTFEPSDCPQCASGQPISKPGSRPSGGARP